MTSWSDMSFLNRCFHFKKLFIFCLTVKCFFQWCSVVYTRTDRTNMFEGLAPTFSFFVGTLGYEGSKQHTASVNTLLFEPAPLLDEAHEGSDSCPRADHDDWVGGFEGQAELRLADVHGYGGLVAIISDQFVLQPVGGNSFVDAACLSLVLHHYSTDVDAVGMNLH